MENKAPVALRDRSKLYRYSNLALLLTCGGALYPMLYMRQIYQTTMLEAFQITDGQLGELYSILGLLFFLTYAPSGWLADKLKPMILISLSLVTTGLLGLWYSTLPEFKYLLVIFGSWGITTGFLFWGASMKRIRLISRDDETGKFFGIFDGGKGLIEAILASIALFLFSYVSSEIAGNSVVDGLVTVIYMYSFACIGLGIVCLVLGILEMRAGDVDTEVKDPKWKSNNLVQDVMKMLRIPEVWLVAVVIAAGYHLFWATYSFSGYLQEGGWGFTAVMAGTVTTIKLWMRPIGGAGAGWLGDRFQNVVVLRIALILSAVAMSGLIFAPISGLPESIIIGSCVALIIFLGLTTYAIRGLYWAIIEHVKVPPERLGLAIGVISVIGYSPDIFIPLINGYMIDAAPDHQTGYQWYFGYIIMFTVFGVISCTVLKMRSDRRKKLEANNP